MGAEAAAKAAVRAVPVSVRVTQNVVRICERTLKHQVSLLRRLMGVQDYAVGVWVATDEEIRQLNKTHRGKDRATDVLSFPMTRIKAGEMPPKNTMGDFLPLAASQELALHEDPELGDIVLGMPYIKRWCEKHNHLMEDHIPVLINHGLWHCLGYDHESDEDYEIMKQKETETMTKFWIELARTAHKHGHEYEDLALCPDELPDRYAAEEAEMKQAEAEFAKMQKEAKVAEHRRKAALSPRKRRTASKTRKR